MPPPQRNVEAELLAALEGPAPTTSIVKAAKWAPAPCFLRFILCSMRYYIKPWPLYCMIALLCQSPSSSACTSHWRVASHQFAAPDHSLHARWHLQGIAEGAIEAVHTRGCRPQQPVHVGWLYQPPIHLHVSNAVAKVSLGYASCVIAILRP